MTQLAEITPADPQVISQQTPTGGGQEPGTPPVTFDQGQVDAILAERLRRERARTSDYDELKAAAAELQELKTAQLSELDQVKAKNAELEQTNAEVLQLANDRLIAASLTAQAAAQGLANPELAMQLADLSGITVAEDGQVEGAAEAVQAMLAAYPYLGGRGTTAPVTNAGAGGGQRTTVDQNAVAELTSAERQVAQNLGLTLEEYASGKT